MANHQQQQQHEKKRIEHFSHKHPLSLIEIEEDEEEMSKSDEYSKNNRSFLRCYGCTEKIGSGVPYYRCEEVCPSFCLHHSCAHLPTTIRRFHSVFCDRRDLQLMKRPNKDSEYCTVCDQEWYRFAYVCSDCGRGVDVRCAMKGLNEAKHSFHQHPLQPFIYSQGKVDDDDDSQLPVCSVCSLNILSFGEDRYVYYRCNYCNFIVHPQCTNVPDVFESPSHNPRHRQFYLDYDYPGSKICKICEEEIDRNTQWAYVCLDCDREGGEYFIHAGYEGCLTRTIRKGDLQHFDHEHPLALVEEEAPPTLGSTDNHSIAQDCRCCGQKISCMPYYTCIHCKSYALHKLCAHLPTEIQHPLHPNCPPELLSWKIPKCCDNCYRNFKGFAYHCFPCNFNLDIECALKTQKVKTIFHKHPLFLSPTKGPYNCHACDRDNEGSSYQCTSCKFWLHDNCASLPVDITSHEHPCELHLVYDIPEKFYGEVVYCRICMKALKRHIWAYHCNQCRYLTHAHDCSDPRREGDGLTIDASDVVDLPLDGEPMLKEILTWQGDLQHFDHEHSLFLVEEEAPPTLGSTDDHSIAQDCCCCGQKISYFPYYTCIYCKSYDLHKLCALLPTKIQHPLHPNCPLKLLSGRIFSRQYTRCDDCKLSFKGFACHCSPCDFALDIRCALKTQKVKKIFHEHPLFISPTKGPYNCHACDIDNEGSSYQCTSCKFWLHDNCASLPVDITSHEHPCELHLVYDIPEKFYGEDVYCRICMKALKRHIWAYHCNLCRYFIHVHDCSNHVRERDGVTIDASDVVHLPLDGEPILEEKLTDGKITKHHRHPMILFADQLESNVVTITTAFMNLIRGSETWPIFRVNGKDYSGITFSFNNNALTMQVTGVPRYIKHEAHHHVLESTFLNLSTWCHACEQSFLGRGFKCTTCAFTIDTYCALLPRIIKHRYDKHGFFSLLYSAIEGVEEYVCEICEEDVLPRYFYHCVACDQSIHARCIWKAYVQFQPYYKLDLGRRSVLLVPPSEKLPECIICKQKETHGHGFAFRDYNDRKYMVHLRCIAEDDLESFFLKQ